MTKRGSRRKSSKRAERAARAEAEGKRDFSALKLWSKRIALWGGATSANVTATLTADVIR